MLTAGACHSGGGLSGLSAAHTLIERGANVLVLGKVSS